MLAIILIWLYCTVLSILLGNLIQKILFPEQSSSDSPSPLFYSFFIGFAVLNFFTSLLSLFLPTNYITHIIIIFVLATGYFFSKTPLPLPSKKYFTSKSKAQRILYTALLIVIIITIAYNTSGTAKNTDTYLYHAQSIHWIESYPAIKGLGNFFVRFAYNSSWFIQTALFSFSFLSGHSCHVMSGLLFTAFSFFILTYFYSETEKSFPEIIAGYLLIPLAILTLGSELSSPSTDLPSALLVWLIILLTYRFLHNKEQDSVLEFTIFLTSIFAVTIKISVLPIIFIPAYFILQHILKRQWKKIRLLVVISMLCLTPWIIRSIIQSGYLIYPVQATGLPVEWKIPSSIVESDVEHIRVWGFEKTLDNDLVLSKSYWERMNFWFYERTMNQKGMILGSLLTPIFTVVFVIFSEKKNWSLYLPFLTCLLGGLYWAIISPNMRFGYTWILMINAIFLGYMIHYLDKLLQNKKRILAIFNSLLLISFNLFLLTTLGLSMKDIFQNKAEPLSERIYVQMDYLPRSVENCTIYQTDYSLFCAKEYYECGYDHFPCLPWQPVIGMYDETNIQKGFFSMLEE